jgi:hypothetical protein
VPKSRPENTHLESYQREHHVLYVSMGLFPLLLRLRNEFLHLFVVRERHFSAPVTGVGYAARSLTLTLPRRNAVILSLSSKLILFTSMAAASERTTSSSSKGRTVLSGISAIWNWDP